MSLANGDSRDKAACIRSRLACAFVRLRSAPDARKPRSKFAALAPPAVKVFFNTILQQSGMKRGVDKTAKPVRSFSAPPPLQYVLDEIAAPPTRDGFVFPDILKGAETEELRRKYTMQENSNVKDRVIKICHEALNWDKSICPSGTWCRHSFATNLHNAGVDMDYISESMGHSSSDHAITQIYIEHYPLEIQMENNSKLLNLEESSARDVLLAKLASMSTEELAKLFTR